MQKPSAPRRSTLVTVNSITVCFFTLVSLYAFLDIFSDGDGLGFGDFSIIGDILSQARNSGLLDVNGDGIGATSIECFFPFLLWIFGVFVFFFFRNRKLRHAKPNKTTVFSGIMLVIAIVLFVSFFSLASNSQVCVPDTTTGSSPTCQIRIRPDAPIVTPGP